MDGPRPPDGATGARDMKRTALTITALVWRWLNGKPDPRAAHRMIVAVVAAVALLAILSPVPAAADHGHNCVWSGGAWVGQGLCPGMPGYTPHTATPTVEPTPEPTTAPSVTTAAPVPSSTPTVTRTTPAPAPARTTTAPAPTPTPTPTRTPGCLMSYGNAWCTGGAAVPSLYPLRVLR